MCLRLLGDLFYFILLLLDCSLTSYKHRCCSPLEIIKKRLEQDTDLPYRSIMTTENIIELLGFCLNKTYFLFQDQLYEQTKGAAMGSPVSPIVAKIYMEAFENRAISTALHPPGYERDMLMIPL